MIHTWEKGKHLLPKRQTPWLGRSKNEILGFYLDGVYYKGVCSSSIPVAVEEEGALLRIRYRTVQDQKKDAGQVGGEWT
jgi:hypothetical protein